MAKQSKQKQNGQRPNIGSNKGPSKGPNKGQNAIMTTVKPIRGKSRRLGAVGGSDRDDGGDGDSGEGDGY